MHAVGDDAETPRRALTGSQVAALAAKIVERYPVYEVLVLFLAYSGYVPPRRKGWKCATWLSRKPLPARVAARCGSNARSHGEWVTGTPKSKRSKRTVPLPPSLAERMADYLAEHPRADDRPRRCGRDADAEVTAPRGSGAVRSRTGRSRATSTACTRE